MVSLHFLQVDFGDPSGFSQIHSSFSLNHVGVGSGFLPGCDCWLCLVCPTEDESRCISSESFSVCVLSSSRFRMSVSSFFCSWSISIMVSTASSGLFTGVPFCYAAVRSKGC